MSSRYDELERLQRLREAGALTEEEFQAEKGRLLGHGAGAPLGDPRRTETVEIVDEDAPQSRKALYIVLGGIGLVVAIAMGLLLGHDVGGGRTAPESNVAAAENIVMPDESSRAALPPPSTRRTRRRSRSADVVSSTIRAGCSGSGTRRC